MSHHSLTLAAVSIGNRGEGMLGDLIEISAACSGVFTLGA
jgi:hypothetical protein